MPSCTAPPRSWCRAIGLTRLPVMGKMMDDVVGTLHEIKRLLPAPSA